MTKWKKLNLSGRKKGIRVRYDKNISDECKKYYKCFFTFIRKNYVFPIRVNVYVKATEYICAKDGAFVIGTFFRPNSMEDDPYIKVAAGDYDVVYEKSGKGFAVAGILHCLAHEFTHYFQWLNQIKLTYIGEERQATNYANRILDYFKEAVASESLLKKFYKSKLHEIPWGIEFDDYGRFLFCTVFQNEKVCIGICQGYDINYVYYFRNTYFIEYSIRDEYPETDVEKLKKLNGWNEIRMEDDMEKADLLFEL